jgi:hypothetical protein
MLWWQVHDRDAPELIVAPSTQSVFDRGHRVGAAAQAFVPGGVLIDEPYHHFQARIDATRAAIDAGARAIYEAAFMADGVFVSVGILEREPGGHAVLGGGLTMALSYQVADAVRAKQLRILLVAPNVLRALGGLVDRAATSAAAVSLKLAIDGDVVALATIDRRL